MVRGKSEVKLPIRAKPESRDGKLLRMVECTAA